MRPRPRFCHALQILAFALPLADATPLLAAKKWDITVIGDMTEAGKKLTPPTREKPVTYVPLIVGHREEGGVLAGEPPPPARDSILRQVAETLAESHYYVVNENRPPPTLLLLVSWGSLNANILTLEQPADGSTSATGDPTGEVVDVKHLLNPTEMRALVAGNTVKNFAFLPGRFTNHDWDAVQEEMLDARYFVSVVAFDWEAARAKKRVLLWATKMSIRSNGLSLAQVTSALIKSGGPMFGRETTKPLRISVPAPVREGRVDIGTPQEVRDAPRR